jgi:nucleoside-diphosphate kinase
MVKPDGAQRGLIGEIMERFEKRGFQLVACKQVTPGKEHFQKHYADLSSKKFFTDLI